MNIWIVKTGEQTEDDLNARILRSGQLFDFLRFKNHNLTWFNSTFNHQKKIQRFYKTSTIEKKGGKIIYLYGCNYENNISFKRFKSQIINALEFYKHLKDGKFTKPDLIIASYPSVELAFISCIYAKNNKIPFVIDVRDMWPEIIFKNLNLIYRFFFIPVYLLWNLAFKYILKNSKSIISISDHFLSWALKKSNVKKSIFHRYFHLTKPQVDKKILRCDPKIMELIRNKKEYIKIIYCGSISKRHDFETFFDTLNLIKNKKIITLVCGKGIYFEELKKKYKDNYNIEFIGWMDNEELNYLLSKSDYGLLPYNSDDFSLSYPNKLAEYLSNNLKIISCIEGITNELIQTYQIGYLYEFKKKESLLKVLENLDKNNNLNSIKLYNELFDYEKIMRDLTIHLEEIAKK